MVLFVQFDPFYTIYNIVLLSRQRMKERKQLAVMIYRGFRVRKGKSKQITESIVDLRYI